MSRRHRRATSRPHALRTRREALAGYLRDGRGRRALHRFFSRFPATAVVAHETGLVVGIVGAYLYVPWPALGDVFLRATPEERGAVEVAAVGGRITALHWPHLDWALGIDGLVWDAALPAPGQSLGQVEWLTPMPHALRRWVAPAYRAAERPMPVFQPVPIRQAVATPEGMASTGCAWCDLDVRHARHLDAI